MSNFVFRQIFSEVMTGGKREFGVLTNLDGCMDTVERGLQSGLDTTRIVAASGRTNLV
jgi:hypothetical protein